VVSYPKKEREFIAYLQSAKGDSVHLWLS